MKLTEWHQAYISGYVDGCDAVVKIALEQALSRAPQPRERNTTESLEALNLVLREGSQRPN
jgi:hypothetical protein